MRQAPVTTKAQLSKVADRLLVLASQTTGIVQNFHLHSLVQVYAGSRVYNAVVHIQQVCQSCHKIHGIGSA